MEVASLVGYVKKLIECRVAKSVEKDRTVRTRATYQSGRASLYYVWEISGKHNHCLLRVRED
jgi:hypothetical protein